MRWKQFDWLLDAALAEDAAACDVTSLALVPPGRRADADVVARRPGVVCGLPLAARLVCRSDADMTFEQTARDGDRVAPGAVVARLCGPAVSVLAIERTMLNFLQQLSGVATLTARFVAEVEGTSAKIYDTRKTTPGWRKLQKYAVRCGGGCNHRMDLAEQALIKDNHLAIVARAAEAIPEAIKKVRAAHPAITIEVEVDDLSRLESALTASPDIIMLDNMTPEQTGQAVALARRACRGKPAPLLEASGTITLENVADYAAAGVDMISVGALTHSAPALDLSLEFRAR